MSKILRSKAILAVCLLSAATAHAGWKKQPSGTMAWLHAVHFADAKKGWIAGSKGTLLTTEDGGNSWTAAKKFTNDAIRDVYFADTLRGWLLCEGSVYGAGDSVAYLMLTDDGGRTWKRQNPFRGRDRMVRMFFLNARFGCAVGEGGSVWCSREGSEAWRKQTLPVRYLMMDGRVIDENTFVLVGGGGTVLRTDNGGADWTLAVTPIASKSKVNSVHFLDGRNGWAVGADGKIMFTGNGGQSWVDQISPIERELTDVFFRDRSEGFAVGDGGVVISTTNGGAEWAVEATMTEHRLESIAAAGSRLVAVGFGGTILVNDTPPAKEAP